MPDADRVPSPRSPKRVQVPRGPARGRVGVAAAAGPLVQLNVRLPVDLDEQLAREVNAEGDSRRTKQEIVTEALRAYFASRPA
ncbi:hypothetical protein Cma02nite_19100 [Cellulomonas marina]|uniref:Ribbon-helix-helix protein, copG family n=1 Tax=Cellulomonas marina TaxID=988821 RepID=A0A1I1ATZ4_9CELL|nr:hypothetical protein Cma02nite_19100 [Cellulomonas marina]SFB39928.1 hypothetical protein SAMN05421867_12113 [Cellulomonas marina]